MNLCKETSYAADAVNKLNIPDDGDIINYIQEQSVQLWLLQSVNLKFCLITTQRGIRL